MKNFQSRYMRYQPLAIGIFSVVIFIWQCNRQKWFFEDDVFIYLRYAVNFVGSGQISWNLNELIEGYTNFLQVMIVSGLIDLGVSPVYAIRFLNIVAFVGLMISTLAAAVQLAPASSRALAVAVAGFLIASSAPVVLWMLGGLEADIAAAFAAAAVAAILPALEVSGANNARVAFAGILFGLAYLTRPDSVIAWVCALIILLWRQRGDIRRCFNTIGFLAGTTAAVILVHLVWRYSYYGDLLPNTFYAKMALPLAPRAAAGLFYLAVAMVLIPAIPIGLIGAIAARYRRMATPQMALLVFIIAGYMLSVLWEGGDHMVGARLLVPVVAPSALLVVATVLGLGLWRSPQLPLAVIVLTAAAVALIVPKQRVDGPAYAGFLVGKYIETAWPAGSLVALHTAGSTPFFAPQLKFIDMLGLNDRTIAHRSPVPLLTPMQKWPGHAKGDGAYVLARKPAYIIAGPVLGTPVEQPFFLTDVELSRNPEFHRCYRAEIANIGDGNLSSRLEIPLPLLQYPLRLHYYRRVC